MGGAWTADGSELHLVDSLNKVIWRYSGETGELLGSVGEPLRSILRELRPNSGRPTASGMILQVHDDLLVLDKHYRPERKPISTRAAATTKSSSGRSLQGINQWAPVGQDIVAFGDVQGPPGPNEWEGALVRFPLSDPSRFQILKTVSVEDDERTLFRTAFPYISAIENTAYVLTMGNRPKIERNRRGSAELEPLKAFPPGIVFNPVITTVKTPQDFVSLMITVEESEMVVGLYSWKGSLYVLARAPRGNGTRWTLSSIDPIRDRYTGTVVIPTNANHLTVIPGPDQWAFLEKGRVEDYGRQNIPTAFFVPAKQLTTPLRNRLLCSE